MADRFLLQSDFIARKALINKTIELPRTLTNDLLPAQDRVLNLGNASKAFNEIHARTIILDNGIVGNGSTGPTGPTGPAFSGTSIAVGNDTVYTLIEDIAVTSLNTLSSNVMTPQSNEIKSLDSNPGLMYVYSGTGTGYAVFPDNLVQGAYVSTTSVSSVGTSPATVTGGVYSEYSTDTGNMTRIFQGFSSDFTPVESASPLPAFGAVANTYAERANPALPVPITCISPLTLAAAGPSVCTLSSSENTFSFSVAGSNVTDGPWGSVVKYLRIKVGDTFYKVPLYADTIP